MIIGFACGMFDLFHPGHVLMLQECKENCDYLIVALNEATNISQKINPGKRIPYLSLAERKLVLESCRYVDKVISYSSESELLEIIKGLNVDIRFLGDDYIDKPITGAEMNHKIHYINRDHGFSTTRLIKQIIERNQ